MPATNVSEAAWTWFTLTDHAWESDPELPSFDDIYVDRPEEALAHGPVPSAAAKMVRTLLHARGPRKVFVTGQKGVGKSMTLRKMHEDLGIRKRFGEPVLVRCAELLPPSDVDTRALLIAIASMLAIRVERDVLKLEQGLFDRLRSSVDNTLREWIRLLSSDRSLTAAPGTFQHYIAQIKTSVAQLQWEVLTSAERRQQLRTHPAFVETGILRLISALLEVLREAAPEYETLLLIEDADKYSAPSDVDKVFLQGASTLLQIPCKAVVTFPYWLHFDPRFSAQISGAERVVLYNVKTVTRAEPHALLPDAQKFFDALYQRLASPALLDSPAVMERAVLKSGGIPRQFVQLLERAFRIADGRALKKVDLDTLEDAIVEQRRDLTSIAQTEMIRARMKQVRMDKRLGDREFYPLLDALLVVEFVNGGTWYDVHPVLEPYVDGLLTEDRERLMRSGLSGEALQDALRKELQGLWFSRASA